jgi:hypothetical protein
MALPALLGTLFGSGGAGTAAAGGLVSGAFGLLANNATNNTLASAKAAELRGQTFGIEQAAEATKWGLNSTLANQLAANRWAYQLSPDLQLQRDMSAKNYELDFLNPKQGAFDRATANYNLAFENSPAARQLREEPGKQTALNNTAEEYAKKTAMFGPIAHPAFASFRV